MITNIYHIWWTDVKRAAKIYQTDVYETTKMRCSCYIGLTASVWTLPGIFIWGRQYYQIANQCRNSRRQPPQCNTTLLSMSSKGVFNHISWVADVIPTDHSKSVCNFVHSKVLVAMSGKVGPVYRLTSPVDDCSYSNWPSSVGPQLLCNRLFGGFFV